MRNRHVREQGRWAVEEIAATLGEPEDKVEEGINVLIDRGFLKVCPGTAESAFLDLYQLTIPEETKRRGKRRQARKG